MCIFSFLQLKLLLFLWLCSFWENLLVWMELLGIILEGSGGWNTDADSCHFWCAWDYIYQVLCGKERTWFSTASNALWLCGRKTPGLPIFIGQRVVGQTDLTGQTSKCYTNVSNYNITLGEDYGQRWDCCAFCHALIFMWRDRPQNLTCRSRSGLDWEFRSLVPPIT